MPLMPYVTHNTNNRERISDIFSCLLEERIIFIGEEITDMLANLVIAQMLYLESVDPNKDICVYINSPGGSVSAGLAIYDTMKHINCDVSTVCCGMAASMASVLLAAGTKGKRMILPNAEVMIHQPLGGAHGQATDILIHAHHIERTREKLNTILSEACEQPVEKIMKDTERDNFMSSSEALEYGLIDQIVEGKVVVDDDK